MDYSDHDWHGQHDRVIHNPLSQNVIVNQGRLVGESPVEYQEPLPEPRHIGTVVVMLQSDDSDDGDMAGLEDMPGVGAAVEDDDSDSESDHACHAEFNWTLCSA